MKKVFSLLMFCLLFASSAHAISYGEWQASVVTAASELLNAQNTDGSFDWKNDGNSATSGPQNTQGATGRGLVAAYNATGDSTYLNAANRVADWLDSKSDGFYNKDIEFFYELKTAGGRDYTLAAETRAIDYINEKMISEGGADRCRSRKINVFELHLDRSIRSHERHQTLDDRGMGSCGTATWGY